MSRSSVAHDLAARHARMTREVARAQQALLLGPPSQGIGRTARAVASAAANARATSSRVAMPVALSSAPLLIRSLSASWAAASDDAEMVEMRRAASY